MALREVGLRDAKDNEIWHYAVKNNTAIVTKDEDFAERCLRSADPPIMVWLRLGNATNPVLLDWFLPLVATVIARIRSGDRLIEVR